MKNIKNRNFVLDSKIERKNSGSTQVKKQKKKINKKLLSYEAFFPRKKTNNILSRLN